MRVFIDTNVIVDVIARREPFFGDSQDVLALCALHEIEGLVSDLTFCNLAYIMRKQLGKDKLRAALLVLKHNLHVVSTGDAAISTALQNEQVDFEDAVQLAAAIVAHSDIIVTRNGRHFINAPIEVLTPTEFLSRFTIGGLW